MKKKLSVVIAIILTLALSLAFTGCDNDPAKTEDYGTLTVANVTLAEGEEKNLEITFSKPEKAEPVEYTFEGDAIEIKDGKVKALKGGVTVAVNAETEHHKANFTVTVTENYGTMSVENITASVGEEKEINVTFSKPEKAEPVEYTFEGDAIEIKDGKIKALKSGATVTVTATTAHHTATFTVTIAEDYGTLTVNDIEGVMEGTTGVDIEYTFSNPAYAEAITYTFDGNDIEIVNGKINVLVGGKTVTVTAKTSHHETTFTVTTLIDYGELNFTDVYAWVGYPASELDYAFSKPERKEAFTYKYDTTKLTIDAEKNTVKALVAGDVEVTVESEHFADKFTVHAEQVNKNDACYTVPADFNTRIAGKLAEYRNKGNDGHTTLFIGDSFFDERWFWTDFNRTYAGKDALIAGVSSSTTYDWEHFTQTFLKNVSPKQIAMHMGTNNVYDDKKSATETVSSLQRMFYLMHDAMPQTHIYWFNISQRSYDDAKIGIVATVNSAMKKWAANREWITLIDTSSKLTTDMLRDNVHPKLEYYSVFVNALKDAGVVIEDAPVKEGVGFTAGTYNKDAKTFNLKTNARTRAYLMDGASEYSGNFVVSGTAKTSANGNNPWTEFIINKAPADDWFSAANALPVSNITFASNGNSAIWGYKAAGGRDTLATVDITSYTFTVIAYNGSVLFKVNDSVKVYTDTDIKDTYFGFGTENAELGITNLSVTISDDVAIRAKYDQLAPTPSASIDDIERDKGQGVNDQPVNINYKNHDLRKNYVLSGKVDVTDCANNAHLVIGWDTFSDRLLLWDNQSDGNFKMGYAYNGAHKNDAPSNAIYTKEAGKTLTLEWKLVVTNSDAYFYVNGDLRLIWKGIPDKALLITSEHATCKFYDMTAKTLADDKAEYEKIISDMKSTIDAYKNNAAGVYRA